MMLRSYSLQKKFCFQDTSLKAAILKTEKEREKKKAFDGVYVPCIYTHAT